MIMRVVGADAQRLLILLRTPHDRRHPLSLSKAASSFPFSTTQTPPDSLSLTPHQLARINLLIPRLCQRSDHLPHVFRLLDTILLLPKPPPLTSLSLPVLFHCLAQFPDASLSMSLLTRLSRNPRAGPHLIHIATLLLASYLKARKTKEALTVFRWMSRPENLRWGKVDGPTYGMAIAAFCRNGRSLEALKVLKGMVGEGVVPGEEARRWVYRSLLREARVKEAVELDGALSRVGEVGNDDDRKVTLELIDRMVRDWRE